MINADFRITAQQCLMGDHSPYDEMNLILLNAVKIRYDFFRQNNIDRLEWWLRLPNYNNTTLDFPVVFLRKKGKVVAQVVIHKNIFYGSLFAIPSDNSMYVRRVEDSSAGCFYWTAPVMNQWVTQVAHQREYVPMEDLFEILAGNKKYAFNIMPFSGGKK